MTSRRSAPPGRTLRTPRLWLLAGCLLLTLTACRDPGTSDPTSVASQASASTTGAPTASSPSTTPALTPTPRPLPGSPFPADQQQTLADLISRTEQTRGLKATGDFEKRLIGRPAAADYLVEALDEGDRALLTLKQEVYRLLGLVPEEADLVELQISLLRGLVLGFYDPDVKALFVLSDLGLTSSVTRLTIIHEVVHALQDQHYDINATDLRLRDDWDASMAYIDLLEGDARGTETDFVSPSSSGNLGLACSDAALQVNRGSNIPLVVQRELQAPYADGMCFVWSVRGRLPEGMASIYRDLPSSTEQVLHPQKYLEGEDPRPVALQPLAATLGAGWRQTASSTFGEFGLQTLLLQGLSEVSVVKRGAEGWGGDRWALYAGDGGARLLHLSTVWDTEADAKEFWQAFLRSVNVRSNGAAGASLSALTLTWEQSGKTWRAALSGDTVTIVVSTDAAAGQAAAQALGLG